MAAIIKIKAIDTAYLILENGRIKVDTTSPDLQKWNQGPLGNFLGFISISILDEICRKRPKSSLFYELDEITYTNWIQNHFDRLNPDQIAQLEELGHPPEGSKVYRINETAFQDNISCVIRRDEYKYLISRSIRNMKKQ